MTLPRLLLTTLLFALPTNAEDIKTNPAALHERGVEHFYAARIPEAIADWDREIALVPFRAPYHWQRGLALYYAGEYEKGVAQFESHQKVNRNDVENAAWHFLCVVRAKDSSVEKARKKLIPIAGDSRVPMKEVHNLFAGKGTAVDVLAAAKKNAAGDRLRNQLCYAHLYLGLYYEALGEKQKSATHIKLAAVDYKMDHYMGKTAQVHHKLRTK
ncbi:MAG: hypothetical protein OSA48_10730 [Akkermansiaceae bacterium]|jgi:lipoprotein NlpI|nr:hypothetical protein [Akkermansiaceae bacterium]